MNVTQTRASTDNPADTGGAKGAELHTPLEWFDRYARAHARDIAVVDPADRADLLGTAPVSVTWEELSRVSSRLAQRLQTRGVGRGDFVLVQLPNVWELVACYVAIARLGATISPMPLQWRGRDISYVAERTGAKVYIGASTFRGTDHLQLAADVVPGVGRLDLQVISAISFDAGDDVSARWAPPELEDAWDDVFTLCWTSGTTARPKGCPMTNRTWAYQVEVCRSSLQLPDLPVYLATPPLVNMAGLATVLMMWMRTGGELRLHHPLNFDLLLDELLRGVDYSILVPAILNMIVNHPQVDELDLSRVGVLATGGAASAVSTMKEFQARWGIDIVNIWGQNEGTALLSTVREAPNAEQRVDHLPFYGEVRERADWPMSLVETKIVDSEGTSLRNIGDVGELLYRGPNVFPGYFGDEEATRAAFTDEGFLRTGDLFRIAEGNLMSFVDRAKDLIIRGGQNISAVEIESVVMGHPDIVDAAAVGNPDEILGERVCLFVVLRPDSEPLTLESLTAFLRSEGFATYKMPERLEVFESLPRNPVGKLLKNELRQVLR